MTKSSTVIVNQYYQVILPLSVYQQLNIQRGDRLLADVQDGMLILLPQPQNYTAQL